MALQLGAAVNDAPCNNCDASPCLPKSIYLSRPGGLCQLQHTVLAAPWLHQQRFVQTVGHRPTGSAVYVDLQLGLHSLELAPCQNVPAAPEDWVRNPIGFSS